MRHASQCSDSVAKRVARSSLAASEWTTTGMPMDLDRFDRWTRRVFGRRPALGILAGGFLSAAAGLPSAADARNKKKKKRCRRTGRACRPGRRCCSGRKCVAGRCCDQNRVFVQCPNECLCAGNTEFCCVGGSADSQKPQCQDAGVAPEECCPPENVCADVCCDPLYVCDRELGECVCRSGNQCPSGCCDLSDPDCECIEETGVCGPGCPSGGGTFLRVRRIR
jgi:hypothetical protein